MDVHVCVFWYLLLAFFWSQVGVAVPYRLLTVTSPAAAQSARGLAGLGRLLYRNPRARAHAQPRPRSPHHSTSILSSRIIKQISHHSESVSQPPRRKDQSANTYHSIVRHQNSRAYRAALIHSLHYMYHSIARWTARAPGGMAPGLRSARTACRARSLAT